MKKYSKLQYYVGPPVAIVIALIFIFSNKHTSPETQIKTADATSLAEMAREIVAKCQSVEYKPTCYEEEVPKLMNEISMRDTFKVTHAVQQEDPSYTYCHVLGHKLAANEVAKDPERWLDVVNMCPSGECSNGCIHGAFQEKFRTEALSPEQIPAFIPQIENVCEKREGWNPTGLEIGTCYHALGHLLMYVTSADTKLAADTCDKVALKSGGDYRALCYDGVYMQIFQPLEPEDFVLIEGKVPKKAELAQYCAKVSGAKEASCWSEGWPLYRAEIMTPEGVVKFCNHFKTEDFRRGCYTDLFYVVTAQVQFDTEFMKNYCSKLPEGVSGRCFASTASRLIETDYGNMAKSANVCKSATKASDKNECFEELVFYSTFNFHPGSEEFKKICNELEQPWKNQCLSKNN